MSMKSVIVIGAVAVLLQAGGCGQNNNTGQCADNTNANFKCDGTSTVKTGQVYTDVIGPRCVETCHKAGGNAISYGDYSTAAAFQSTNVGQKSLYAGSKGTLKKVDPNNLQNSSVWLKVIGGSAAGVKGPQCEAVGNAMPDGKPALSDTEKAAIKNWICSGAAE
jgi:hypothetical protein